MIRTKSVEIPQEQITSPEMKTKIAYLKKCLRSYRKITGVGRGIAAVQVGIAERFAVIFDPQGKKKMLVIINPTITKKSQTVLRFPEGCMSVGLIFAPVDRPGWIEFSYYDERGQKQFWDVKDDTLSGKVCNRVFQHEIDHMDGTIYLDRADIKNLVTESDPAFYSSATFEEV